MRSLDVVNFEDWDPERRQGRELLIDLPLEERQGLLADQVELIGGHPKHHARSALFHLGRAWSIAEIDPEMAMFRCITSEEEAATAILRAVQSRHYKGSRSLNPRNHVQKNALVVFVEQVGKVFGETGLLGALKPQVVVDSKSPNKPPTLHLALPLHVNGKPQIAIPEPPLGFELHMNGEPYTFEPEFKELLSDYRAKDTRRLLKDRVNLRNRLLYASQDGIPFVDPSCMKEQVQRYRDSVFHLLLLFLMIAPHPTHQLFVQQALSAFIEMLAYRREHPETPGEETDE